MFPVLRLCFANCCTSKPALAAALKESKEAVYAEEIATNK
jgi:hypothetical protein